jgi:hypothetical protein
MSYTTKNDPRRIWKSWRKLIWLALRAGFIGAGITLAYAALQSTGVVFIPSGDSILSVDITTWAVLYNLFAAVTVALVVEKYPKLSRAVLKGDKEEFLLLRDERLSLSLNLITGTVALGLLYMMGCRDYASAPAAEVSIGGLSFVMALIFLGVRDLQDFSTNPWFRERVPADWWTASVDEFFLEKKIPDCGPGTKGELS